MSCAILIQGEAFNVDKVLPRFLMEAPELAYQIARKGEAYRRGRQAIVAEQSSLTIQISSENCASLADEIPVVRRFLLGHMATVSWLARTPGVKIACVEVVMQLRDVPELPLEDDAPPEKFNELLKMAGLRLRVSFSGE